jgi:hypothetical protein
MWMTPTLDPKCAWMQKRSKYWTYSTVLSAGLSDKLGGKRPSTGAMIGDFICQIVVSDKLLIACLDFSIPFR